jgi:hypothetical protein
MLLASARRGVYALLVCWVAFGASRAAADEHVLEDLPSVHEACRRSEEPGRRVLHVLEVPSFRFDGYDREGGRLLVDTRRNLRALRGAVEVLPKDLEDVAFVASPERARELRRRGRALRLGFFLGFDGEGQPCVVRAAVGVTLVRAELAFAELVDADGRVVAREDMDRLRAWLDDEEQDTLPGEGPRAAVVAVAVERGAVARCARGRSPKRSGSVTHASTAARWPSCGSVPTRRGGRSRRPSRSRISRAKRSASVCSRRSAR